MPRHILSVDQFTPDLIKNLFTAADLLDSRETKDLLQGRILTNLFYEASSRTAGSFHAAMLRLGGSVIPVQNVQYSSVSKGENLPDTIRTFATYCDAIALRHSEVGAAAEAAAVSPVPIINAGDGVGEHPTQALLDLYTIYREQGRTDNLVVTMVGDLKHGRTVHSLAKLLRVYSSNVRLNYVAPPGLQMPEEYVWEVLHNWVGPYDIPRDAPAAPEQVRVSCRAYTHLTDLVTTRTVLAESDVVYMTRAQRERFQGSYDIAYGITPDLMAQAKPTMTLMHPLPRNEEIPPEIDADPRAAYFRQMEYGLRIRMALLMWVFGLM